jgi:hypothetical protein
MPIESLRVKAVLQAGLSYSESGNNETPESQIFIQRYLASFHHPDPPPDGEGLKTSVLPVPSGSIF